MRPSERIDSRFLYYLCLSQPFLDRAVATSVGTKMPRTDWEQLSDFQLNLPPLPEQRRIAAFLGHETARIDTLIAKKNQLKALLGERANRVVDSVIWSGVESETPLMRVVDQERYGIVLPGPDVTEGVPIVKAGDIAARRLSPDRLSRTRKEIEAPYARARLEAGDLVFAIRGSVGDVAMVPPGLQDANITQDVARIAPGPGIKAEWLLAVMRTRTVQQRARSFVTGASIRGINIRDLERVRIPLATPERQEADLARVVRFLDVSDQLVQSLERQIVHLHEHREALITVAMSGGLSTNRGRTTTTPTHHGV